MPVLIISILSFISVYWLKTYIPNMHFIVAALLFGVIYLALTWIFHLRVIADITQLKTSLIK